jgi:hypothetical protein
VFYLSISDGEAMGLTCQRTLYINEAPHQSLLRSFFNLTATATRASNIMPIRKNMRVIDNPAELAAPSTDAAGALGSDGRVFVTSDCVITPAPLVVCEGDVREETGALEAGPA